MLDLVLDWITKTFLYYIWYYDRITDCKLIKLHADMAELADAPDLGSGGNTRAGSTPVIRIFLQKNRFVI